MVTVLDCVLCPRCATTLDVRAGTIVCAACGQQYPRFGPIPVLLADPSRYLAICGQQLRRLEQQVEATAQAIGAQLRPADVVPLTKARCHAIVDAARGQVAELGSVLRRFVGEPARDGEPDTNDDLPSLVTNVHYLFRDWGWPSDPDGENERALSSIERVLDQPSGRMLVVGAGGCRLAYDLHRRLGAVETVAVDIDPLLFAVAHEVIRGGTITLREAYAEITELECPARPWTLKATDGPLDDRQFHFMLADGLEPPFPPGSFDTVLTPWFIDAIPSDLRDLMAAVHRILTAGGRWVSLGPLRYTPQVPISRRFTREEIFDLGGRAGFRISSWRTESIPTLVSKHSGRGKVEWVMTFAATKEEIVSPCSAAEGPPSWLLFRHVPVPRFPGQSLLPTGDPLVQLVASAIDGTRTLDDLATLVRSRLNHPGLSRARIREAVRTAIAEVHPGCRA